MVLASGDMSLAVISQNFDLSGRLVTAEKRPSAPQAQKMRKYSVPEGIELRSDIRYEFYPVFGKTFAEIIRSTEENGPRNEKTKKRQPSAYDWHLGWTYDFSFSLEPDEDDEKVHCDLMIVDPVLSYDIIVTLPALTDDSALNPMEKDLWKNYISMLLERVNGRIKIIKDDSRDVIIWQFGEIAYLSLTDEEVEKAEGIVERYVRKETERIGSNMIRQIQQKLAAYDSGAGQDLITKPTKTPSK
jgi:Bacterial protein of unknown function (DUF922)